jgi:succinate-acetate transporter protein
MHDDGEPDIRPEQIARVFIRPLGSVLPLGFLVFGSGAFLTACYSLGWLPPHDGRDVFEIVLIYVVPVQAVASVLAFLARDTAGGTTMAVFAATWAALATLSIGLKPGETSPPIGTFLLADCVVIVVLAIAALFGNPAFSLILLVACARFATNGAFELTGTKELGHIAGWIGLVLAAVAGYVGLAFLLEDARHASVLPFIRQGAARESFEADLLQHLRRLEREPGVRTRL